MNSFDQFFQNATGYEPLVYQRDFAGGDSGRDCRSHLIHIPTGLGKTAAVVLAWLWNRVELGREDWPRRLIYCLPMRTLVEQTMANASEWVSKVSPGIWLHVLMGGEEATEWELALEQPAILVGTQDMLLSGALNRGYSVSRYRWPIHFGALNNDCLWVMDEVQLMGPGLSTACQLEAFRNQEPSIDTNGGAQSSGTRLGSYPEGRSVTWYMSATADIDHLRTRDWRSSTRPEGFVVELSGDELASQAGTIAERRLAVKRLETHRDWNFGEKQRAGRTEAIVHGHLEMVRLLSGAPENLPRRTLVICNTVDRAIAVHAAVKARLSGYEVDLMLMHSRFRPDARKEQAERLNIPDIAGYPLGQIIVATQVIEAGVDLSSAILWTEIGPLASLVQRLGRLNRKGEFGSNQGVTHAFEPRAIVVGIEAPDLERKMKKEEREKAVREAEGKYKPYDMAKCDRAWAALEKLMGDASPAGLTQIKDEVAISIDRCPYSLQRHELLDFFDTGANLSLGFTDVSPFVRGMDPDTDIYVAWREWFGSERGECPDFWADFQRQELCPVSIGKVRDARALLSKGWIWRGKDAGWGSVRNVDLVPGMTVLLPTTAGGYSEEAGWTGREEDNPVESVYEPGDLPSDEEMLAALENGWQSIAQHTGEVTRELEEMIDKLDPAILKEERAAAIIASHWHDIGKNHESWKFAAKRALENAGITLPEGVSPLAKFSLSQSPRLLNEDGTLKYAGKALKREVRALRQSFRPGIAHEVASALAFRQSEQGLHGAERPIESLLAEYLIMGHHGRVRKVLRDEIPRDPAGDQKDTETVRGVSEGDEIAPVVIAGRELGCPSLSIDCRKMGRDASGYESYTRGVLRLLKYYGPFRLAFFEALFRAADIRASARASQQERRTSA